MVNVQNPCARWHAALSQERLKEQNTEARVLLAGARTKDAYEAASRKLRSVQTQQALRWAGTPLTALGDFVLGHGRTPDALLSPRPCGRGLVGGLLGIALVPIGCCIGGYHQAFAMVDGMQRTGMLVPAHLVSLAPKALLSGTGALLGASVGRLVAKCDAAAFDLTLKNERTLLLEPVNAIDPKHLFISSDRYAFDLRELESHLAHQRDLTNPYTMRIFCKLDRERLMRAIPDAVRHLIDPLHLSPEAQRLVVNTVLAVANDYTHDYHHATIAFGEYFERFKCLTVQDQSAIETFGMHREISNMVVGDERCIHLWSSHETQRLLSLHEAGQIKLTAAQRTRLRNAQLMSEVGVRFKSQRHLWSKIF